MAPQMLLLMCVAVMPTERQRQTDRETDRERETEREREG